MNQLRNLVIVLGDQLDTHLSALDGFDAERDVVWMAENATEATRYWDFLDRNLDAFRNNRRMAFQVKNIEKKRADNPLIDAIRGRARDLKTRIEKGERI